MVGELDFKWSLHVLAIWLELNKIGVGWCDWEVLEVVVKGAVGDVGGEGREGVLRGERAGGWRYCSWQRSARVLWDPRSGTYGGM